MALTTIGFFLLICPLVLFVPDSPFRLTVPADRAHAWRGVPVVWIFGPRPGPPCKKRATRWREWLRLPCEEEVQQSCDPRRVLRSPNAYSVLLWRILPS